MAAKFWVLLVQSPCFEKASCASSHQETQQLAQENDKVDAELCLFVFQIKATQEDRSLLTVCSRYKETAWVVDWETGVYEYINLDVDQGRKKISKMEWTVRSGTIYLVTPLRGLVSFAV